MASVAEQSSKWLTVQVVHADDADRCVYRMIRHFTQKYVTVGILFTPIDADMTLTPVGADTGRFQTLVRLLCRFYDPSTQVILII